MSDIRVVSAEIVRSRSEKPQLNDGFHVRVGVRFEGEHRDPIYCDVPVHIKFDGGLPGWRLFGIGRNQAISRVLDYFSGKGGPENIFAA